jgi:hypothetical protein
LGEILNLIWFFTESGSSKNFKKEFIAASKTDCFIGKVTVAYLCFLSDSKKPSG